MLPVLRSKQGLRAAVPSQALLGLVKGAASLWTGVACSCGLLPMCSVPRPCLVHSGQKNRKRLCWHFSVWLEKWKETGMFSDLKRLFQPEWFCDSMLAFPCDMDTETPIRQMAGKSIWGSPVLIFTAKKVSYLMAIIVVPVWHCNVIWFHRKCFWSSNPNWFHIDIILQAQRERERERVSVLREWLGGPQ